jgi:hypothetical protein
MSAARSTRIRTQMLSSVSEKCNFFWSPCQTHNMGNGTLIYIYIYMIKNLVALVRERPIPIERPSFVDEVSAKFCG